MNKRVRVIKAHTATYAETIKVKAGAKVQVGGADEEWSGWVWCTAKNGKGGWVPMAFLEVKGETGKLRRDYTGAELSVEIGDELTVLEEESGWLWCENDSGAKGWVPAKNVEKA